MKDKELKPCPFCGGETVIRESLGHFYLRPIHNKNCIIKPDTWLIADKPLNYQIKAWNRRVEYER